MKLFVDTNVWLRFLLSEQSSQHIHAQQIMNDIESGFHTVYTSSFVLLECGYVLEKVYLQEKRTIQTAIEAIVETRNLTLLEETHFSDAFTLHKKTNKKLSDCLIVTQIPVGVTLCSFDIEMKKLYPQTLSPKEISNSK